MSLLIVIPFDASQAESAERLCDFIYYLSGKSPSGSCLLIAAHDTHPEMRIKVRLAAEVAFENVNLQAVNGVPFEDAAKIIAVNYKSPWLWLEPDCVPLKQGWMDDISKAYDNQPKKFMGAYCKNGDNSMFMARQAVYPAQIDSARTGDPTIYSTKCRLIQIGKYEGVEKLRPDAVIFCSDKTGALISDLKTLKGQ